MPLIFRALMTFALLCAASVASADKLPLNSISNYLNAMKTAQGDFTQINDDGSISTGTIYIKRPGKMRFEYNAPDSAIVIASNNTVVVDDKKSNQPPESYPLKRTPLSIILARNVNLGQARMVTGHSFDGTATVVTAQDPKNPEYGSIAMKFTGGQGSPVELRQWVINDSSGGQTTVILGALNTGSAISNAKFKIGAPGSKLK